MSNSNMSAEALQLMLDRHQLRELALTYSRACDRQDFPLVRSLYHDDAIDDHGEMFRGTADEYVAWLPTIMEMWDTTTHSLTNMLFEIDGDHAQGELYVVAYHRTYPPDAQEIVIGGRYLDKYEKRDGVWKFSYRSLALDWCNVRKVNLDDYTSFAAGAERGRHSPEDPSYLRLDLFQRGAPAPR
jgi:hypothetical protein